MATILEEELETYLFEWKPNEINYEEHPIGAWGKCYRQVEVRGYGVIDLLYIDVSPGSLYPQIDIHIVELKKDNIDFSALGQICRYKTGLDRFIDKLKAKKGSKYFQNIEVRGILVGSDYASGDICYAVDNIEWLTSFHYKLDLGSGIEFEESRDWYNSGENFRSLNKYVREWEKKYIKNYKEELKYNFKVALSNKEGSK